MTRSDALWLAFCLLLPAVAYAVGEAVHYGGMNPFMANAADGSTGLSPYGPSQQVVSSASPFPSLSQGES